MMPKTTSGPIQPGTGFGTVGILALSFLWAGMLLGVSFLATPIKFHAPSLSLPVALDVGRHTFEVFNRVEIACSLVLIALALFRAPARWIYAIAAVPCGIVAVETAWLLPALDARVEVLIAGGTPPESGLHILYIALDAIKLAALLALTFGLLRHLVRAARPAGPMVNDVRNRPGEPAPRQYPQTRRSSQ